MEAQLQYAECTKITHKIPFHRFERFQYMVLAQYLIDQSALDWRSYHYDTCRLCFSEHFPVHILRDLVGLKVKVTKTTLITSRGIRTQDSLVCRRACWPLCYRSCEARSISSFNTGDENMFLSCAFARGAFNQQNIMSSRYSNIVLCAHLMESQ